jgi:hypothetical protein
MIWERERRRKYDGGEREGTYVLLSYLSLPPYIHPYLFSVVVVGSGGEQGN